MGDEKMENNTVRYLYYPNPKIEKEYFKFYDLGKDCKRKKQYDMADKIYKIIIETWGETGILDVGIAKNLASRGDYPQAIEFLKKAISSFEYSLSQNDQTPSFQKLKLTNYRNELSRHLKTIQKINAKELSREEKFKYLSSISGDKDFELPSEKDYQNALVIFIDLLGTKEKVNNFDELFNSNMIFKDKIQKMESPYFKNISRKSFTLSDCCFIIYKEIKIDGENAEEIIKEILICLGKLSVELLNKEIVFRGGISYGKIWNDSEGMFGEAANKAYILESTKSKYIRICIDKVITETFPNLIGDSKLIWKDDSGENYLNIFYLTQIDKTYSGESKKGDYLKNIEIFIKNKVKEYKREIKNIIENKDESSLDYDDILKKYGHILQKYVWFERYIKKLKISN